MGIAANIHEDDTITPDGGKLMVRQGCAANSPTVNKQERFEGAYAEVFHLMIPDIAMKVFLQALIRPRPSTFCGLIIWRRIAKEIERRC